MTSETPSGPPQPPSPGWWLASDGRWYPPQSATPQPPMPPVKSSGGKGCLIALAIAGVLGFLVVVSAAVAIFVIADKVEEITVGDVYCPTEEAVSDLVGSQVDLSMSGSVIVAAGCNYTSAEANGGAAVSIVSGAGLISEEVISELEAAARSNGTEAMSIEVGDGGRAFGSAIRSQAATKADGKSVQVEIFSESGEPIGDKRSEAVELLEQFIDLND